MLFYIKRRFSFVLSSRPSGILVHYDFAMTNLRLVNNEAVLRKGKGCFDVKQFVPVIDSKFILFQMDNTQIWIFIFIIKAMNASLSRWFLMQMNCLQKSS